MKKEYKKIKKLSKKLLQKHQHKKIKKIKSYDDKTEGLKYLIASSLKLKLLNLEIKSGEIPKKEALPVESKLATLKSKIKIFESTHHENDLKVVQKLIREIKSELKNV